MSADGNPLRSLSKGNDFATLSDAQRLASQEVISIFGPMAQLVTELCERVQVLEDAAGIMAPDKNVEPASNGDSAWPPDTMIEASPYDPPESISGDIE